MFVCSLFTCFLIFCMQQDEILTSLIMTTLLPFSTELVWTFSLFIMELAPFCGYAVLGNPVLSEARLYGDKVRGALICVWLVWFYYVNYSELCSFNPKGWNGWTWHTVWTCIQYSSSLLEHSHRQWRRWSTRYCFWSNIWWIVMAPQSCSVAMLIFIIIIPSCWTWKQMSRLTPMGSPYLISNLVFHFHSSFKNCYNMYWLVLLNGDDAVEFVN